LYGGCYRRHVTSRYPERHRAHPSGCDDSGGGGGGSGFDGEGIRDLLPLAITVAAILLIVRSRDIMESHSDRGLKPITTAASEMENI